MGRPGRGGGAGLAEQGIEQFADHAHLFGDGNELVRRDQAAGGVIPARQRFEADQVLRREPDDRLEIRLEFPACDAESQVGFQFGARLQGRAHLGREDAERAPPIPLAFIHGQIGGMEQQFGVRVVRCERSDPDRGVDMDLDIAPGDRTADRGDQLLRQYNERIGPIAERNHRGEFVAAEAGHDAAGGNDLAQSIGDDADHRVSGGVTMNVVDWLEPVEVDDDHGKSIGGAGFRQTFEQLEEVAPIGEPGQRIVTSDGFGPQFGFRALPDGLAQQE